MGKRKTSNGLMMYLSNKVHYTFIVLTSVMSFGVRVLRAEMADSKAGRASARSLSHSFLMP